MVFVPIPMQPSQPSRQAEELAHRLEETIDAYQRLHSPLSRTEVRQALRIAGSHGRGGVQRTRSAAVIGAMVAVLLAGLVVFRVVGEGGDGAPSMSEMPVAAMVVGVGVFAVLVALIAARVRGD